MVAIATHACPPARMRTVPAWDKLMRRLVFVHDNRMVPNKRDRYLLDDGILERMPNPSRRYIQRIRDFMQQWFHDPLMRHGFEERVLADPVLEGVHLRVGKPRQDGTVHLSITTRKGFITVSFDQNQFKY